MKRATVPPLRMEVNFRNNIILRMMEATGCATVAELCRRADLNNSQVGELINMKELPLNKDGSWRIVAIRLATFFNCLPEDMFSEEQLEMKLVKNRAFAELTFGQVQAICAENEAEQLLPDICAEKAELKRAVGEMVATLTPREEKVIRLIFGIGTADHTLLEVAKMFDVKEERIRQIEARVFRKLRNPARSDRLRQHLDDQSAE